MKFLKAAKEIIESGRTVILYCSDRTEVGAETSASHTASIAGDYLITKNLAQNIGVTIPPVPLLVKKSPTFEHPLSAGIKHKSLVIPH